MKLFQYVVTGRQTPSEKVAEPKIFRMRLFARNHVVAKSRFWYFMKKLNRIKKTNGEILDVSRVEEPNRDAVKPYGIWLRYDSRTHTHNMYKEFLDVSPEGAVGQMYDEMASRHKAASCTIQVLKIKELAKTEVRRSQIEEALDKDYKYPHIRRRFQCPKNLKRTFVPGRVSTFFN